MATPAMSRSPIVFRFHGRRAYREPYRVGISPNRAMIRLMGLLRLIWCAFVGLFRSKASLEAENLVLRQQLNVLRRKSPKRLVFSNIDRLVFTGLYHFAAKLAR
jgi:hypothetical protein